MKNQKKIQQVVQENINKTTIIEARLDDLWLQIQENAERLTGIKFCSYEMNLSLIAKKSTKLALDLNTEYMQLVGQRDLLRDFGTSLADAGFWNQ